MRRQFIEGLIDLASRDERIVLLTADLGFGTLEAFRDHFPTRFFNLGVTEQAAIGVATGLAQGGFVPYFYSIASFAIARTFEFLRNGPVAHGLPVRIIGVGPGFDYSLDGLTHFALEDLALVHSQPGTTTFAPIDGRHARELGSLGSQNPGLVYYRLARNVPESGMWLMSETLISKPCLVLGLGDCGTIVAEIVDRLNSVVVDTQGAMIQMLNSEEISGLAQKILKSNLEIVVTVENHYVSGGFGSMLADELMKIKWRGHLHKWGVERLPVDQLGSQVYVQNKYATQNAKLVEEVLISRGSQE